MATQTRRTRRTKRTRRTRLHKKRQRGGSDQDIKDLLDLFFPTLRRYVNNGKVYLFCNMSEHDRPPVIDLNTNPASGDSQLIYFEIIPPTIKLHSLQRCPGHSGTSILQRIMAMGRLLSLDRIELDDASMVGCNYLLYTLSILQHGETWYHRMGFRSADYEEDKKIHEALRHLPFEVFVPYMFRKYGRNTSQTYTDDQIHTYLEEWYAVFPEIRGKTVAQVAHMIPRGEEIDCKGPPATLFRDFLFMASSALPYERYVTLDLRPL